MEDTTNRRKPVKQEDDDDLDIAAKFGASASTRPAPTSKSTPQETTTTTTTTEPLKPKKPKKEKSTTSTKPAPPPPSSNQPMILVTVNDRLGTKAQIPCLASDPVGLFKRQVAARVGRQPHEILLKRQGERPFKDVLTLEDYGVSNGVQLDLELDTGD
ncbi:MAG: hypothetical protein M1828_005219 [Chrysothrix sp. TS-e1954]|nr:MAG: hypothetical protein M1828_005219 [Chrysothrix sp. TS-e1954]